MRKPVHQERGDEERDEEIDGCAVDPRNHPAWNITSNLGPHDRSERPTPALEEPTNVESSVCLGGAGHDRLALLKESRPLRLPSAIFKRLGYAGVRFEGRLGRV